MNTSVAPWQRGAGRVAAVQPGSSYLLAVPADARARLARGWLWLGLVALIGSGLLSVLLVRVQRRVEGYKLTLVLIALFALLSVAR